MSDDLSLTKLEAILLTHLLERDREVTRLYLEPLQNDFNTLLQEVATRMGFFVKDYGVLYTIDASTMSIQMIDEVE